MPLSNPTARAISTGSYTGDNTDDRQIATGFKCAFVINIRTGATDRLCVMTEDGWFRSDVAASGTDNFIHASDGFIVNVSSEPYTNLAGVTFLYIAVEE